MCRLFAFRSTVPRDVRNELLDERNSLRFLSREHPDGWGIATWDPARGPDVLRGIGAAHLDPDFARAAGLGPAEVMFAHVRQASVGSVQLQNVHPFVHGRWAFMHNGTLTDFARHQAVLEARIDPDLRAQLTSTTDSERCFFLFLTLLRRRTGRLEAVGLPDVAWAVGQLMALVSGQTDVPGGLPSSMNFLVSDGRLMLASRRGRSLFFSDGTGRERWPDAASALAHFAVASERPSEHAPWVEVAEDAVFGVDPDLMLHRWTVPGLVAAPPAPAA